MSYKLSGLNPLSYMGVEPTTPPLMLVQRRSPTSNDINFNLGSFWLNKDTYVLYHLVSVAEGTAVWQQVSTGVGGLTGDTGGLVPDDDAGNINMTGADSGLLFEGDPNTHTMSLAWPTQPETESMFVGVTGEEPKFLPITSTGGTVIVTQTSSAINFEATTGGNVGVVSLTGDTGGTIAPDMAGDIKIVGGDSGITVAGDSMTSTLTLEYQTPGTDGQLLIGSTGSAPAWADVTSSDNTIIITPGAGTLDLRSEAGLGADYCSFFAYQESAYTPSTSGLFWPLGTTGAPLVALYNNGGFLSLGDGSSTPALFTAPVDGVYQFVLAAAVAPKLSNQFARLQIQVNLDLYAGPALVPVSTTGYVGYTNQLSMSLQVSLLANDEVRFGVILGNASGIAPNIPTLWGYTTTSFEYPASVQKTYISGALLA